MNAAKDITTGTDTAVGMHVDICGGASKLPKGTSRRADLVRLLYCCTGWISNPQINSSGYIWYKIHMFARTNLPILDLADERRKRHQSRHESEAPTKQHREASIRSATFTTQGDVYPLHDPEEQTPPEGGNVEGHRREPKANKKQSRRNPCLMPLGHKSEGMVRTAVQASFQRSKTGADPLF